MNKIDRLLMVQRVETTVNNCTNELVNISDAVGMLGEEFNDHPDPEVARLLQLHSSGVDAISKLRRSLQQLRAEEVIEFKNGS